MARHAFLTVLILALFVAGCQSAPTPATAPAANGTEAFDNKPAAYLGGKAVMRGELYAILIESAGGEALSELLLDRALELRLSEQGLAFDEAALSRERQRLLDSLSDDDDEAARLLDALRQRRGLGEQRFAALLRRNAGLRLLVAEQVVVGEPAIRQAYALRYGTRYRVRLITAESVAELTAVRRRVVNGASFTDQAIAVSTDVSASQGGLLSPISPADATYPLAVRDALPTLSLESTNERLSPVIAMPDGYALLWLEDVVDAQGPPLAEVRGELERGIRLELERVRMQQLARVLIEQANVIVLDPALDASWQRQRGEIVRP